jgi:large subunit ribosomal protein L10
MSRFVKESFQSELEKRFADVSDFVVLDTKGIGGNDNNEMRGELKKKGIKVAIVKNALMRRAVENMDMAAASSLFMAGPCAVAYGGDSVVDVAKEMSDWAKKLKDVISLKGAYVDGVPLDEAGAIELSKMPNRVELQGAIVMLANSPGRQVAGAIAGPGGIIAGCIKAIADKDEAA